MVKKKLIPRLGKGGWGIIESVTTVLVAAVLSIPLFWMFISSRSDAAKAINYLRALEIANETIDWISSTPVGPVAIASLEANSGTMVDSTGKSSLPYRLGSNPNWTATPPKPLYYPDQYCKARFSRDISVQAVKPSATDHRQFLYRATVTVSWSENNGSRKVVLSTLLCDERRGY